MRNDELEPMDDELAALLHRGAPKLDASDAARARVLAKVSASLSGAPPVNPLPAAKPAIAAKLIVPIAAFLLGGAAGAVVRPRPAPEVRVVYVEPPAPSVVTAPSPIVPAPPQPAVVAVTSASAKVSPSTSSPPSANGMLAERAMLDEARASFARGDHAGCLRSLALHRDRYPSGTLAEEREALAVRALSALGRRDEARVRADRFRAKYPTSVMLPAVEAAVAEQ